MIYIKQVFVDCDMCGKSITYDPSNLPVSSGIPAWTSQGAISSVVDIGWSIERSEDGPGWSVLCPRCKDQTPNDPENHELYHPLDSRLK